MLESIDKSENILISEASDLSGLEYNFLKICLKLKNTHWIILSRKKSNNLIKELDRLKISYTILKFNYFKYVPTSFLKFVIIYFVIFLLLRKTYKSINLFSSGLIPVLVSNLIPFKNLKKYVILRNDIRRLNVIQRFIFILVLEKAQLILTNSIFNHKYFSYNFKNINSIHTFDPPSIDKKFFTMRKNYLKNRSNKDIIITLVSSMRFIKNPNAIAIFLNKSTLIRKDLKFKLIGKNNLEIVKPLLSSNTLKNIYFCGQKSRAEVLQILSETNYFLSLSFSEGNPNSVLEAMTLGIPCILSDIYPHKFLSSKSGNYLIPLKTISKEVKKIVNELSNEDSIGHKSKINFRKIENLKKQSLSLIQVLERICESKKI